MTQNTKVERIVEWLNDGFENDAMYWKDEFGCEPEDIIEDFGFGYDENHTIKYLPDLDEVRIPVDALYAMLKDAKHDKLKMRILINEIFRESAYIES